jgi:hypothetical protein
LFALHSAGGFELGELKRSIVRGWPLLLASAACQGTVSFVALARYRVLLHHLGVRLPLRRLIGPALVSQAIGTWLPASMAVTEALRLGLMLGVTRDSGAPDATAERARIAVASVVDRTVGLAAMFIVGGILGLKLVLSGDPVVRSQVMTVVLSLFSLASGAALLLLPALARGGWLKVLIGGLARIGPPRMRSLFERAERASGALAGGFAELRASPAWFLGPGLLSALVLLISGLGMYLPGQLTSAPPAYLAIVVGVPLLSLAQLLPLGFAGLGSQQVLTVGTLSIFALDASSVATASLLQNGVGLITTTLLGGAAATFLMRDYAALRRRRET